MDDARVRRARRAESRCGRRRLRAGAAAWAASARTARRARCPRAGRRRLRAGSNGCCSRPRAATRRSCRRVERGLQVDQHRRPVRLARVLVLAHPLHAHRATGNRAREQHRVGSDVVGAVVAVAARALDVDAAHLVGRRANELGERVAQRVDALAVGPDDIAAVGEAGDRARRPDRAVHLVRPLVARGQGLARTAARRRRCRARGSRNPARAPSAASGTASPRGQARALVPLRCARQRASRDDGLVLALADDAEKASVANDLATRPGAFAPDRRRVRRALPRAPANGRRARAPCRRGADPARTRRRP